MILQHYCGYDTAAVLRSYTLATESGERASIIVGACLVGSD
jgi:hypothetical protein